MSRIAKADVHQALNRAAQQLIDAAGLDQRVSRADMKRKLGELEGTEKRLCDIFFRFIDHRDAAPGAVVTGRDVKEAVEYAKQKLIDRYDLNNNGLSRAEIAGMSRTGQLAVQLARELKQIEPAPSPGVNLWCDGLPAGRFADLVEEQRQEWFDANIMNDNGVVLSGGVVRPGPEAMTAASLADLGIRGLETDYLDFNYPPRLPYELGDAMHGPLTERSLDEVLNTIADDGFFYDMGNPNNVAEVRAQFLPVLEGLGDRDKIDLVVANGRARDVEGDFDGEDLALRQFLFVNRDTGVYVEVHVRECDRR